MIKLKDTYVDTDALVWVQFMSEDSLQIIGPGYSSTFHNVPAEDMEALRAVMEWKRRRYPLWQKKADLDTEYGIQSTEDMLNYQRRKLEREAQQDD